MTILDFLFNIRISELTRCKTFKVMYDSRLEFL